MTTPLENMQETVQFTSQKPLVDPYKSGTEHKKQKRKVLLEAPKENGEQDLFLKLLDSKWECNKLFLGRSKTFEKDKSPENYNILVPIVPRCYTTPDRDPAHACLPPKGWIYIIRRRQSTKGKPRAELWRELKSEGNGFFRDVHLGKYKGQDHRKATGQAGLRIVAPYCIDQEVHELWIAFSEVQWSWARVQRMKKDSTLRNRRMHKLDLSDCLNDFDKSNFTSVVESLEPMVEKLGTLGAMVTPILQGAKPLIDKAAFKLGQALSSETQPEDSSENNEAQAERTPKKENTALLYNLKSAPDSFSRMMPAELKDPIPVVYLDNSVGIAKRLGLAYQASCSAMIDYVRMLEIAPSLLVGKTEGDGSKKKDAEKASAKEKDAKDDSPTREDVLKYLNAHPYDPVRWFESAKILNQFLYARLPDIAPEDWSDEEKTKYLERKKKHEDKLLEYREKIDEDDLKKALRTEERQELRRAMKQTKRWLTDFLKHELLTLGEESALLQALDDYFTLPATIPGAKPDTVENKAEGKRITVWPEVYPDAWKTVTEIIRYLDKHLYAFDGGLETPAPDGWSERKNDAGMDLLIQIADPQCDLPIHRRLFPKIAEGGKPLAPDRTDPENPPEFKAACFQSLKGAEFDRSLQSMQNFPGQFEEVIAMDDRADPSYVRKIVRVQQSLCRLLNAYLSTELEQGLVTPEDILAFKEGTVDAVGQNGSKSQTRAVMAIGAGSKGHFERVNKIKESMSQGEHSDTGGTESRSPAGNAQLLNRNTSGETGGDLDYQIPRRAALGAGQLRQGHLEQVNEKLEAKKNSRTNIDMTVDSGGPGVTGARPDRYSDYEFESSEVRKSHAAIGDMSHVVTSDVGDEVRLVLKTAGSKKPKVGRRLYRIRSVMILKEDARKRLADLIGKNEANIKAVGKLLSIVETINLVNAFQTVMNNKNDDKRAVLAAELVSSFCDAAVAVGEAAKRAPKPKGAAIGGGMPKIGGRGSNVDDVLKRVKYLEVLGYIGGFIDIGLTWQSMVENYRQNDDVYIAKAIQVSGFILTTFAVPIGGLMGLAPLTISGIGMILILVGLLAAAFVFLDDTHIETWLANGPFAAGERDYWHRDTYSRTQRTIIVHDQSGRFVRTPCTLHRYGNGLDGFWLAVDNAGILVDVIQGDGILPRHRLRQEQDGRVYLKAGQHPLAQKDTLIGVIGRPFRPLPLLQPQVEERFMGHTPGADPMSHAQLGLGKTVDDPHPNRRPEYRCALWCEYPHEAYAALMDALFRPCVISEEVNLSLANSEIRLHVHTPYLLEKSQLFIHYKRTNYSQVAYTPIKYDCSIEEFSIPENQGKQGNSGAQPAPTLKDLKNGSNRFTIRFSKHRDNKCELKVRIDLFGDHTVCLPCEPLFCETDISTDAHGHRWVEFEKVFPEILLA
jgi:hypothetical protein